MSPLSIAGELLSAAIALSGLPAISPAELPPLYALSAEEMAQTLCPDQPAQCRAIAALFDTERYRILILSSLKLDDPEDNSFLVHELVHVLQFKVRGDAGFAGCQAIVESEREAYQVQNRYLAGRGLFAQQGMMMRYMHCQPESGAVPGQPSAAPLIQATPP